MFSVSIQFDIYIFSNAWLLVVQFKNWPWLSLMAVWLRIIFKLAILVLALIPLFIGYSKALFNGNHCKEENLNFIKGTLSNLQKHSCVTMYSNLTLSGQYL